MAVTPLLASYENRSHLGYWSMYFWQRMGRPTREEARQVATGWIWVVLA